VNSRSTSRKLGTTPTTATAAARGSFQGEGYRNIAQNFSTDRASLLGHVPRKKINNSQRTFGKKDLDRVPVASTKAKTAAREAVKKAATTSATSQQFLDTPRPFRNVDMVSSNTSGVRFKRSSDMAPEEKKKNIHNKDYYDVTTRPMPSIDDMAMTKMSRQAAVPLRENGKMTPADSNDGRSSFGSNSVESSDDNDADNSDPSEQPSHEAVMSWLLTNLPQLQEEDAIAYFNCLLEDGFDSIDMLDEVVLEEDLYFMKRGHQRALMRSIMNDEDFRQDDSLANDQNIISSETTSLDEDTIDQTGIVEQMDKTNTWIAEQNRLVEERLVARLAEEEEAARGAQEKREAAAEHSSTAKQNNAEDDEFED